MINPKRKVFTLLPTFNIVKYINPLSKAAKKTFDCDWNYYYRIEIGWLFWNNYMKFDGQGN